MAPPNLLNFSNGTSSWQFFDPFAGVSQVDLFFSGSNGTGTLISTLYDWTGGGSTWIANQLTYGVDSYAS